MDARRNAALYGASARPDDIVLSDRFTPPQEMAPLYSSLELLITKTPRQVAAL